MNNKQVQQPSGSGISGSAASTNLGIKQLLQSASASEVTQSELENKVVLLERILLQKEVEEENIKDGSFVFFLPCIRLLRPPMT